MQAVIVHSDEPVTLVGGGPVGKSDLKTAFCHAPTLVAADSGAGHALRAGLEPAAVIGDLDSLAPADRARIPPDRLFRIREQETTDFDKALRCIAAPLVLAAGFLGGRLDLQLAALNTLILHAHRPVVLLGEGELVFHAPPRLELALDAGQIVSLFPMTPLSGRSRGLEWPIDGLDLSPRGRIGTSNRALGPVQIEPDGPGLLVIVPRAALTGVMRALAPPSGQPAAWARGSLSPSATTGP